MTDYEYDENLPYVVEQDGRPVARVAEDQANNLAGDLAQAEKERDALAAVLMYVEDYVTRHYLDTEMGRRVIEALSVEPGDLLREHDAALIEGLADEVGYSLVHHEEAEAFLRREARQRREGQS